MEPLKNVGYLQTQVMRERGDSSVGNPEEEKEADLGQFFEVLRRRKVALLTPIFVLSIFTIVLVSVLPKQYRSTATILIEQQEIPPSLVPSTVMSAPDERIQMTTQRVMTTDNLEKIIEKFNLYPELRNEAPIDAAANYVRGQLSVAPVNSKRGTIAFKVSYDSNTPEEAQMVATELARLFLEENLKTRMESAEDTTGFLSGEAERLNIEINKLEAKIAEFKRTHMGRLPQQLSLNMQLMSQTEQQMQQIQQQIRALEERKVSLQSQMVQLRTGSPGGAGQIALQVQALRTQLSGLLAVYTPDHPDVARLRTEIETLESQGSNQDYIVTLQRTLDERRAELAKVLAVYSPEHPEVKNLQQKVADLELALKQAASESGGLLTDISATSSYISLQTQHQAADREIAVLRAENAKLKTKLAEYEDRITQLPQIEHEYSLLVRDRDYQVAKYQELTAKMNSARVSESLEKARKGERFSLIESPRRPINPIKPNRKKIFTFGFIGAIGAGIGSALLSELLQKAVYGVRGVTALLGAPPLAIIPYIRSPYERRRRVIKWILISLLLIFVLLNFAAFFFSQIAPLHPVLINFFEKLMSGWSALIEQLINMLEAIRF